MAACEDVCDWWGVGRRHNPLRDFCASSWSGCNRALALTEQRVPEWDREVHDGQGRTATEEAVLDVVTSDPQSGHPVHMDVTVTTVKAYSK